MLSAATEGQQGLIDEKGTCSKIVLSHLSKHLRGTVQKMPVTLIVYILALLVSRRFFKDWSCPVFIFLFRCKRMEEEYLSK